MTPRRAMWTVLAALASGACGDVTSDLITREHDGGGVADGTGGGSGGMQGTGGSRAADARADQVAPPNAECTLVANECAERNRERPYCDGETFRCVECLFDGDCREKDEQCSSLLGLCAIPCTDDAPCLADGERCHPAAGYCVECLIDEDCGAGELCRRSECQEAGPE